MAAGTFDVETFDTIAGLAAREITLDLTGAGFEVLAWGFEAFEGGRVFEIASNVAVSFGRGVLGTAGDDSFCFFAT